MRCGDYQSPPYHAVSARPDPTAMLTQNWCEASGCGNGVGWTPRPKPFWNSLAPWRTVWRCKVERNTAHLFRNKFPLNDRSSSKNHFKFPGNFKPILALWRKRPFFSKRTKTLARYSPRRVVFPEKALSPKKNTFFLLPQEVIGSIQGGPPRTTVIYT